MTATAHHRGARAKPPVTSQADWAAVLEPWLARVESELSLPDGAARLDVDRIHVTTGVVADGVQRSMAPIASYLVGVAVGRGAELETACRAVERLIAREDTQEGSESPRR